MTRISSRLYVCQSCGGFFAREMHMHICTRCFISVGKDGTVTDDSPPKQFGSGGVDGHARPHRDGTGCGDPAQGLLVRASEKTLIAPTQAGIESGPLPNTFPADVAGSNPPPSSIHLDPRVEHLPGLSSLSTPQCSSGISQSGRHSARPVKIMESAGQYTQRETDAGAAATEPGKGQNPDGGPRTVFQYSLHIYPAEMTELGRAIEKHILELMIRYMIFKKRGTMANAVLSLDAAKALGAFYRRTFIEKEYEVL